MAFSLFDKDQDGSITLDEVRTVMAALGQQDSDEALARMFKQVDLDGKHQTPKRPRGGGRKSGSRSGIWDRERPIVFCYVDCHSEDLRYKSYPWFAFSH